MKSERGFGGHGHEQLRVSNRTHISSNILRGLEFDRETQTGELKALYSL